MTSSKTLNEGRRIGYWSRSLLLLWAAAILCSTASAQWNAAYTLCPPQYTGVPFTYQPPAVNSTFVSTFHGDVDNDTGWTGAFRYVLSNGTLVPDGAFQMIQNSSAHQIYMSFQMKHDPTFDTEDSIVVAFDPDQTNPNKQRLIIHPLVGKTAGTPGQGVGATDPTGKIPAGQVEYWKGYTPGSGWLNFQADPAFVTVVAQSVTNGADSSWDVQIEIDNTVLGLPAAPTSFGVYVNMVRIDSSAAPGPNTDTQFTWPAGTPLKFLPPGSEVVLEGDSLPDASSWGTGSLATTCSGVNISHSDITGNHGGKISLNQPNQFSVLMHNSGPRTANQVFATFQIANYGLPSPDDWARPGEVFNNLITLDPLPSDASPPSTVSVGSGGGTATLSTGLWTPGSNHAVDGSTPLTEHDYYQATPDTCIRVILSSLATDTTFSVRTSWNNFQTGTTSEFKHTAVVGTKGYKLARGATNHEFNLAVTNDYTPACVEPGLIAKYPRLRQSRFTEVIHGCRFTGNHLIIRKNKFNDCDDVGSYGYDLQHEGPVKGFTEKLSGPGLKKNEKGNSYHLVVQPGQKAQITTTVVSQGGTQGGGHEGGGHEGGGHEGGGKVCGQVNKPQAGAAVAGMFLIGLLTLVPSRKKRG
jgi:hypothetical protein